jgi:hypothetical protein
MVEGEDKWKRTQEPDVALKQINSAVMSHSTNCKNVPKPDPAHNNIVRDGESVG